MLNNQSYLQDFGLIEELDEQAAETISGGFETFTIRNKTADDVYFTLDSSFTSFVLAPNTESAYTAYSGGIISFKADPNVVNILPVQNPQYDLAQGGIYEFQPDPNTSSPSDINLYAVSS